MILDAAQLSNYQACRRRYYLSRLWRARLWRPKSLLTHCLRIALGKMLAGATPAQASLDARCTLLDLAANPGMDFPGGNTYQLAKDFCAILDTLVASEFRSLQPELPRLHILPEVQVSPYASWQPLAQQDSSGTLHRWVFWDRFSQDLLAREAHRWECFGDMAMVGAPMLLHIVLVGHIGREDASDPLSASQRRWHSPWCSALKNSRMPNLRLRFRKQHDREKGWDASWKRVWLADLPWQDIGGWVDSMWSDGEAQLLTKRILLKQPPPQVCRETLVQIREESERLRFDLMAERDYWGLPMSRAACDDMVPCQYQTLCHRPARVADPESLGSYVPVGALVGTGVGGANNSSAQPPVFTTPSVGIK